ncbi:uncharacterized protein [Choristoneura fumiferana]|uniref:uncharacterized protein n=1 Tax=Choristoneura fumiferana TaxID=7141 RepID=UPI003D158F66
MASKGANFLKIKQVAKLVTENRQPCVFCQQDVDDEVIYGKLYALGDIQCHYFCVLLSCCLVQKGKDTEGLFGFLYKDIIAEVERSKKHKCSYCGRGGASLGCSVSQCRKQFHLPCGRRKNVVSLFYGNYKSFCELHAPKQKISDEVMVNVKLRLKKERLLKSNKKTQNVVDTKQDSELEDSPVCVICYEEVPGYPSTQTFWPPCCGRDAWLHRSCLQRMALSAGMHYVKCPLCNDKEQFYEAVCEQGYYLPDRDAAWELEQNAFAEIYERPESCVAPDCACPFGRSHDEPGIWDIKLCILCGSSGMHSRCLAAERMLCGACRPAAADITRLEARLAEVIKAEQEREARAVRSRPVMPSRMSLRRTKGRMATQSASCSSQTVPSIEPNNEIKTETSIKKEIIDRHELNLKTPKRSFLLEPGILKDLDNTLLSPVKMLEQGYMEKLGGMEDFVVNSSEVIAKMRARFNKPKPLSEKKRVVNEILDELFQNVFKENLENNDNSKRWSSPKKCVEVFKEYMEESKENLTVKLSETEESLEQSKEIRKIDDENVKTDDFLTDEINLVNKDSIDAKDSNCSEGEGAIEKSDSNPTVDDNDTTKSDDGDDDSSATFELPSESVAKSDDSLNDFDTPKTLKTVDIEHNSSLEISEHDDVVNINMIEIGSGNEKEFIKTIIIKSPVKDKKCSFKFSAIDKEILETENVDMDVEKFKDHYLNEVDRDFKCNFNHNHVANNDNDKVISSAIDFAIDATRKRKLDNKGVKDKIKKRKLKKTDREVKRVKKLKKKDCHDRKLKLKIKFKDEKKKKLKRQKTKILKQYVLQYSPVQLTSLITKPETDVSPMKRKYNKFEKSPDKLVQTSIQSFFKVK